MSVEKDYTGIVFDTGSMFTKAGFAGENFPRSCFPTVTGRLRHPGLLDGFKLVYGGTEAMKHRGLSNITWPVIDGQIQNWEEMEKIWHHTFYKELHVPPEGSALMYAVHPLISRSDKEKIAEILFESFAINRLYLAMSPALVLHASGRTSGIVWESGASCCYAIPVFEGFTLKHAAVISPITGEALTDHMQEMLKNIGYSFTTPVERDILDNMKAEVCYVAQDYDEEVAKTACSGDPTTTYHLPDGQHVVIGEERFKCPELLFKPSLKGLQCPSIVDNICYCISRCEMDYQAMFYNNIVLSGGSSMFRGLPERLSLEMTVRASTLPNIKTNVDAMVSRQNMAWAGGSILASMSTVHDFWMTKKNYEDHGPDGVNHKFF